MTPWKRWIDALTLPVVLGLCAAGWYGMRSYILIYLTGGYGGSVALTDADAGQAMMVMSGGTILGYLLGGVAALAIGPLLVVAAGLLLAGLAIGVLGLAGEGTVFAPLVLASIGYGIAVPAIYGAAARHLGISRESLRNALFLALWAALNQGAVFAAPAMGSVRESVGFPVLFASCGVLLVFAALLALAAFVAQWYVGRDDPAPPDGFAVQRGPALLSGGVLLLAFLPWILVFGVYDQMYGTLIDLEREGVIRDASFWFNVNPVVVLGAALLLVPVFVLFHVYKLRLPTLFPIGLGLLLMGVGAIPLLFPETMRVTPLLMLALLTMALGEVLAGPLLLSVIAGGWPWRLSTLAVALWLMLARGVQLAFTGVASASENYELATRASAMLGVMLAVVVGLAFAIAAWPLRKYLKGGEESAQEP